MYPLNPPDGGLNYFINYCIAENRITKKKEEK
jgi:hypothetical protein